MAEAGSLGLNGVLGGQQCRKASAQPRLADHPQTQQLRRIVRHLVPSTVPYHLAIARDLDAPTVHVFEGGKHAIYSICSPGRRPNGATQILQDHQRWVGGVGGHHRWQKGRLQRPIQIDLCVKPLCGARIGGALCEGRTAVVKDNPATNRLRIPTGADLH